MRPIFWPGCITESLLQPSLLLLGRAAPDNWTSLRRTSLRCSRAFAAEDLPTCEARRVQGDVRRWTASNFVTVTARHLRLSRICAAHQHSPPEQGGFRPDCLLKRFCI